MRRAESKRADPSIAVSTMSTSSTMTPKNRENHSSPRKTSEETLRSLLRPAEIASVTSRAVAVGDAHQ